LRRNEVDKLKWSSVGWKTGTIRIEAHEFFTGKCDGAEATVAVDPKVLSLLKPFEPANGEGFVISSNVQPKADVTYTHYRANRHFRTLIDWLKKKGVNGRCPIHTLRKECGRMVTEQFGIYAAQKQLRHRDVTTTARYYADDKRATFPKLPDLCEPSQTTQPTPERQPNGSKPDLATDTGVEVASSAPTAEACEASGVAA
jgi:integrase